MPIKINLKMEEKEVKKLTYEELEKKNAELEEKVRGFSALNNQLYQQVMAANMTNLYRRLDYLFKVLEVAAKDSSVFDADFIINCADEVKEIMTPPKQETEE